MVIIKTKKQIEGIRKSCRLAHQVVDYLTPFVKAGISTNKLNNLAHDFIIKNNAIPAPLGYGGYPKSICTSLNNIVCHGIPSDQVILRNGDIINIDVTTILEGYYGDISRMFGIGTVSPEAQSLINHTQDALELSLNSLGPNKYLNDCVGKLIEPYIAQFGYSCVREFGGHGVGIRFHEEPFVFHYDTGKQDVILRPGMIFTIEPMINASPNPQVLLDKKDGWTVYTADGSLSAQVEDTVLITPTGYQILTRE